MSIMTELVERSLRRAKDLRIEETIRDLTGKDQMRGYGPDQVGIRRATLTAGGQDPLAVQRRLERMIAGNDLTDISYLSRGFLCSHAVGRIVIREEGRLTGHGTGFLVAPGVLLTNHHVLSSIRMVAESSVQFQYERDVRGSDLTPVEFTFLTKPEPIIHQDLDIAIVCVSPTSLTGEHLEPFGWLKLSPEPGKGFIGEYLTIIQHPNGERKQICVRENKLLKYVDDAPYVWYQTDTVAGSSGSPVFNDTWDVVALHHSSVPRTKTVDGKDVWLTRDGKPWSPEMGDDAVDWMANEGIRVSHIVTYLKREWPEHPLAVGILDAPLPAVKPPVPGVGGECRSARLTVPVEIELRLGDLSGPPNVAGSARPTGSAPSSIPLLLERVEINQDDYAKRNGYDPAFLGRDCPVPLPEITSDAFGTVLAVKGKNTELAYWNYSVVMNKDRRLAFFSAANVDPGKFSGKRDAAGDKWYKDTRIPEELQIGADFYGEQKTFEASRASSPFDQGHLTRRKDLQWGDTAKQAKRNGDDSFHYTNCSPQHWQFNQNNKACGIWFRLEESAISTLSDSGKLCIINGPVFNAPLCTTGPDGKFVLSLKGPRKPDGMFGGVRIPRMFFKVIAFKRSGNLVARAFVVTQEGLLATVDRYRTPEEAAVLTGDEIRLYQVTLDALAELTSLDFGSLTTARAEIDQEAAWAAGNRPIEDERELIL